MKLKLAFLGLITIAISARAQTPDPGNIHYQWLETYARSGDLAGMHCSNPRYVPIPDIPGYHAYKADLHVHTIFSDAQVTPTMRVIEAWNEGLDVLAITDHQPAPRTKYDRGDLDASYKEAAKAARNVGVKIIHGFELTGAEPIGHINVLFVNDLDKYKVPYPFNEADADAALERAKAEDAYIIGNHPGWPDHNSTLSDYIAGKMADGTIQGVEVFNNKEFYPMSIDHANKYGIAMLGCTDCHYPTYFLYDQEKDHRDMTIIFAKDNSDESLKEALRAGRTIAWANNTIAGRPELLRTFIRSCVKVVFAENENGTVHFRLKNESDIPFVLVGSNPEETVRIPAQGLAETRRKISSLEENYAVTNAFITSTDRLEIPLSFLLQGDAPVNMPVVEEASINISDKGLCFRLACDEGTTYFTTDGTEPTKDSPVYDGGLIALEKSAVIRAVTYKDGEKSAMLDRQMSFAMADKCKGKKPGVKFEYYENDGILSTADITKIGELRKSGTYPTLQITDGEGKDHFGYVFTGCMLIPETGLYSFCLMTNDGSDLYIGDTMACDNDQHNGYHAAYGSIFLQKGYHKYTLRYFEGYGGESFGIQWRVPGSPAHVDLPSEVLFIE